MRKAVAYMIVAIILLAAMSLCFGYRAGTTAISRAKAPTLKRDLLRLDSAQMVHRQRTGRYASSTQELPGLTLSPAVVVAITALSDSAYYADATTPSWTGICRLLRSPVDTLPVPACSGTLP